MSERQDANRKKEEEIDLKSVVNSIWTRRKKLAFIVVFFTTIGLLIALLSPKEFTGSSTFIPQTSESNRGGGSIGGLASLAGINLGNIVGNSEIPPALYPKFVSSVKFRKALLEAPIIIDGYSQPTTYAKYYEEIAQPGVLSNIKKYTIGIPGLILKSLKKEQDESVINAEDGDLIKLTESDIQHFKRLETQLSVTPNEKEGLVTLSFSMPEPLMAAQMAQFAQELLQKEVLAYKISNAREQLKFTEGRYEEKKAEFERIQTKLAYFRDRNQNIASAAAQNQLQSLEAEYNFAFNIYNELAKQLEQARLQVAKDTPIFSVIQPVYIPTEKSAPKRPLIILIFTILGFVLSLGYIFVSEFLTGISEQWNQD